jgi:ABC-type antimicrobial peptide transport system permease subunit
VIVGEAMARRLWPGRTGLGECLRIGGGSDEENLARPCSTVIGVAEDARRESVRAEETLQYYVPLAQQQLDSVPSFLVVRLAAETPELLTAIRREVLAVDPAIRWVQVEPMRDTIAPEMRAWQLGAAMFSLFGVLALLVAAIGLYSVLAFDVAQRTRELGVRAALGASTRRLVRAVVARALATTALGVLLGGLVALLLAGRVEPLLFETRGRDPLSFLVVAGALLTVAVLAAGLPARRAARVDPNTALRAE